MITHKLVVYGQSQKKHTDMMLYMLVYLSDDGICRKGLRFEVSFFDLLDKTHRIQNQ